MHLRILVVSVVVVLGPAIVDAQPASTSIAAPKRGASVPFVTYEAETMSARRGQRVAMSGLPSRIDSSPELEASGRAFVQLDNTGDYVEFPCTAAANTIVVRHCIPDSPEGGGREDSLSLLVNGQVRQSLTLSSKHNWLYGKPGENGQANEPSAGQAHVFWEESRFVIVGAPLQPGDTLRLQKESNDTAKFYRIDLVDLESAPAPLAPPQVGTYLSVTDFGANGNDAEDDTAAIQKCIDRAKAEKKKVWIPSGTFRQRERFLVDGVAVGGAGMWHTQIVGTTEGTAFGGSVGFTLLGDGAKVTDLSIDNPINTRRVNGGIAFTGRFGNCTNCLIENVWITHTAVGFWMSGVNHGAIRNCRVRSTYADAINLNRGSTNCVVEHNHVRGSGDDGLAILSEIERTPTPSKNVILRFNTVVATWWGHNCDVAGGEGHLVEDNLLADNAKFGCFAIALPSAFPMYPTTSATIRRNSILRGGGNYAGQKRGAIWIYSGSTTIDGVSIQQNEIVQPIFRGIHLAGSKSQVVTCEQNTIDEPGEDGVYVEPSVTGGGQFKANRITGLKADFQSLVNKAGAGYKLTNSENERSSFKP